MPLTKQILQRINSNDPTLKELNLSSQYPYLCVTDMQQLTDVLSRNTHLNILILCENNIGDEGAVILATALSKNSNVSRIIDVSINNITDTGAIALLNATGIISLNLAGNCITDAGLAPLSTNQNLQSLIIHDNKLTDRSIQIFLANRNLQEAIIDNNLISTTGYQSVQDHITQNVIRFVREHTQKAVSAVAKLSPNKRLAIKQEISMILNEQLETANTTTPATFFSPSAKSILTT